MHPGQHGASVRPCEPERGEPPRAWHRGCGQAKAKKALAPGQVGTPGSPGTRGTQLSPHLPRLRRGGWSWARSRPPEPPPQPRPRLSAPPPAATHPPATRSRPQWRRPPPGSWSQERKAAVSGRPGEPLSPQPPPASAGLGERGPGPSSPPAPAASPRGHCRRSEPEPSRPETRRQHGLNFPSPPPPAPPAPPAAAAPHAHSLAWMRRAPAPADRPANPVLGRLPCQPIGSRNAAALS